MIFLVTQDGKRLLILEPANLEAIKQGGSVVSPDGSVQLLYTPDAIWLGQQIHAVAEFMNGDVLESLHKSSLERPEIYDRADHKLKQVVKDGKALEDPPR
jgi:hypothetical protein